MKSFIITLLALVTSHISIGQISTSKFPEFSGGEEGLFNFIAQNLKYPNACLANQISGKVVVKFNITLKGEVDSIIVSKSVNRFLDSEAVRIVRLTSGKWTPGFINDTATVVTYTLPITFLISPSDIQENEVAFNSGVYFLKKGKYEKAIKKFNLVLKRTPNNIDALYNCSIAQIKLNDIIGACTKLNRIRELKKSDVDVDTLIEKYCK